LIMSSLVAVLRIAVLSIMLASSRLVSFIFFHGFVCGFRV
jgi:hypothetical protein